MQPPPVPKLWAAKIFIKRRRKLLLSCAVIAAAFLLLMHFGKSDPDKNAVRQWLKENLDSPDIEEVAWYPVVEKNWDLPRTVIPGKAANLADNLRADASKYDQYVIQHKEIPGPIPKSKLPPLHRFICLKYRSKNEFGALVLQARIFVLVTNESGTVRAYYLGDDLNKWFLGFGWF